MQKGMKQRYEFPIFQNAGCLYLQKHTCYFSKNNILIKYGNFIVF